MEGTCDSSTIFKACWVSKTVSRRRDKKFGVQNLWYKTMVGLNQYLFLALNVVLQNMRKNARSSATCLFETHRLSSERHVQINIRQRDRKSLPQDHHLFRLNKCLVITYCYKHKLPMSFDTRELAQNL